MQSLPESVTCPVVVMADPRYVGQDTISDALGPDFDAVVVGSFEDLTTAVDERATPIVVVPHDLADTSGAAILSRLAQRGADLVGVLLVDAADAPRLAAVDTLAGVDRVVMRPLREGVLTLTMRAAAASRASRRLSARRSERLGNGVDQLLRAMRHEFRGQLQSLVGLSGLLLEFEGESLSDEGRDWCKRMERGGERLAKLIDDVVGYLRLAKRPLELGSVELNGLVQDALEDVQFERSTETFEIEAVPTTIRLNCDRRALSAAVKALVDNALYFTTEETPWAKISVAPLTHRGRPGFGIRVEDRGVGLKEPLRERAFELFERCHADYNEGAGVGLAVVGVVAELHQGAAWLEDRPGGGLQATLFLPE